MSIHRGFPGGGGARFRFVSVKSKAAADLMRIQQRVTSDGQRTTTCGKTRQNASRHYIPNTFVHRGRTKFCTHYVVIAVMRCARTCPCPLRVYGGRRRFRYSPAKKPVGRLLLKLLPPVINIGYVRLLSDDKLIVVRPIIRGPK